MCSLLLGQHAALDEIDEWALADCVTVYALHENCLKNLQTLFPTNSNEFGENLNSFQQRQDQILGLDFPKLT